MRETLQRYPTLRATRLFEMIRQRGCQGSVIQVRRLAAELRPRPREAFLRLRAFPAEQGQVDWACFGTVAMGRAKRRLSCLALTLSHSRALAPGVLLRPVAGKLPARPRAGLRPVGRLSQDPAVQLSFKQLSSNGCRSDEVSLSRC